MLITQKRTHTVVKALSCLREFGPMPGAQIFSQLYGKHDIRIRMPGYRAPILLRSLREDVSDVSVFDKVFLQREYDLPIGDESPKIIVDGGAFIGCTAAFFTHKYPQAQVFAIEPDTSNFERLLSNTGQYENVHPIQAALWTKKTWIEMTNFGWGHMALQVQEVPAGSAGAVPTITISDLMAANHLDHIDILKLDIECAEEQLFDPACHAWLDKVSTIMIELHDWIRPGSGMAFYRAISQYPFRQLISGENIVILK